MPCLFIIDESHWSWLKHRHVNLLTIVVRLNIFQHVSFSYLRVFGSLESVRSGTFVLDSLEKPCLLSRIVTAFIALSLTERIGTSGPVIECLDFLAMRHRQLKISISGPSSFTTIKSRSYTSTVNNLFRPYSRTELLPWNPAFGP